MPALAPDLRRILETTVKDARDIAEEAARIALQRLAVDAPSPFASMTQEQRTLRITLRAKGRQLGDTLDRAASDPSSRLDSMPALVAECAYEHWHRLLFARFLAENELLMHPEGVAVSLTECDELAIDEGLPDGWAVATRYAARMLPQIFRPDDPLLQVTLAPESRQALERKVADLPRAVFLADDSLGWVYQFWQARRKEQVNASGEKIDGRTIAAVTQLFTEHYMVAFLLHNSLGAWWAARHPGQPLPLAEGDVDYLRRLEDGMPAAGYFPGWPDRAAELRILDPCGGSGHFMVATLDLLSRMRMLEEDLPERESVDAVLRDNLFMLEIDQRCTQIAAFALALAAWRRGGYRELPHLHVACSGLPVAAEASEWTRLVPPAKRAAMRFLHSLFRQAPDLGSLIDPHALSELGLFKIDLGDLRAVLISALEREDVRTNPEQKAIGVVAQGLADAAEVLAGTYHLVISNVPFLKRGRQASGLASYITPKYEEACSDLATVFIQRCRRLLAPGGALSIVNPHSLLFIDRYAALRRELLQICTWRLVCKLGKRAFEAISGEMVDVVLLCIQNDSPESEGTFYLLDALEARTITEKRDVLIAGHLTRCEQAEQLGNPDARIGIALDDQHPPLSEFTEALHGQGSFDAPCFVLKFWEITSRRGTWVLQQTSGTRQDFFSGCTHIFRWEDGRGMLWHYMQEKAERGYTSGKWRAGVSAWGKKGVVVGRMGAAYVNLYAGHSFDEDVVVLIPREEQHLTALWTFCLSQQFRDAVKSIDSSLKVSCGAYLKVPFDLAHWKTAANAAGPLPAPHSDDPTQWLFAGDIATAADPLQAAVVRLLGYRWPEQKGDDLAAHADADGIAPLPAMSGELAAAERLRTLLAYAYGAEWHQAREEALLADAGFGGKSLETWLRDGFFRQHCRLFHNRPFIWHIWDGRRDGFAALVNYHKLDRPLLEKLAYTYLGNWIVRQQEGQKRGEDGADGRLAAALILQGRLKLILAGEPPYDVYVRWKALHEQPVGWEPDLNDGVRLNIRPFMVDDPQFANAPSILRIRPNIKWGIDRGANPDGSKRDNDVHLTVAEKVAARKERG
jgi:hypothetical protein